MKASAFPRKYGAFLLILVLCAGVFCLFGARKEGLFIDEIYSYGLSNSDHAPYLSDLKGGEMRDALFTRQELDRYLTVDGDGFAAGSVYYNQTKDVHPPLYYWVMNFVSSLVPGSSSKWIGLGVNLFFYLLTLIVLFRLALLLFGRTGFLEDSTFSTSHQNVNVYGLPEKRYEIRSEDTTIDVQVHEILANTKAIFVIHIKGLLPLHFVTSLLKPMFKRRFIDLLK